MEQNELTKQISQSAIPATHRPLVAAAHELKAPLAMIRLYADSIEQGMSAEAQARYARRISLTAEHLLQLTAGMLEGYHWSEGSLPLEPVNTRVVCEEVMHEADAYARELGQTLRLVPATSGIAVAHRVFLKNVLFNLVFNSLRHTPERTNVTLRVRQSNRHIALQVCDDGPGFERAVLERLESGLAREIQPLESGGGIGLAVARQLTEAMDGDFSVTSGSSGGMVQVALARSRQLALVA